MTKLKKIKKFLVRPEFRKTELTATPPVPSSTLIPQWYKDIPVTKHLKVVEGGYINTNVKHCTPFLDAMISGYTFVLSDDISVSWEENGIPSFMWRTTKTQVTDHSPDQYRGIPTPHGYYPHVLKWHNEFFIQLPEGYSLWCTHPVNRFDLPFQVITGFVDCDTYNMAVQFPFFIKEGWSGIIESGTPLAQLIPVKRDEWELQMQKSDDEYTEKMRSEYMKKLVRSYKTRYWHKKSYR